MAGHSHAKNIMHRKAAQGAKKAQAFGKLIREITVSAKQGLPDPAMNPRLRAAVKAALVANMTKDTIDRAIKRASTAGQGEDYQEVRYEGYGPYGVAVIVEALTDNRNRTAGEVRSAFAKAGGALGETNSVSFQFERRGVLWYPGLQGREEEILEAAIEAGAQDVDSDEEGHEITCAPEDFFAVRDAMEARFGSPESAKVEWVPNVRIDLDEEKARDILKLIDRLEESDDVQNVYANFEVSDAVSLKLSA
ncbi:YebC/PmpR family DNA-binding transcriptional regulator [Siccirubricoccus sp. KC 17139]|uniref:Probable transcriptional regulatory protein JYK14_26335 n=1 Tax=Siccirubricoccus soli TaxID=2899147 RepID=A0ABT1DCM7_9PROT|nr:YebC/PmpR family DNA-binding transcriptional regulator [Siccirubricoccus soli]MCO6419659.1 YebC/PmpR family DNA-binding transcriptional regulator [Siccirubricoccus soli]MCP2685794.1 YebC/PmpR family DNA-binding transcriptional regulator [Siccirubricoccus soli]